LGAVLVAVGVVLVLVVAVVAHSLQHLHSKVTSKRRVVCTCNILQHSLTVCCAKRVSMSA
jgi:hypothetical protein